MKPTGKFRFRQSKFGYKLILQMEWLCHRYDGSDGLHESLEWHDAKISDLLVVNKLEDFAKFIHLK